MQGYAVLGLLTLVSAATNAEAQEADPPGSETYVVKTGDTLWDLARRHLSDPFLWPEIYSLNRDSIADPHWIFPGERLRLSMPSRARDAAEAPLSVDRASLAADAASVEPVQGAGASGAQTVFTAAPDTQVRQAIGTAANGSRVQTAALVPAVPRGSFYAASLLIPEVEIAKAGELFDVVSSTSVPRGVDPQIHPYDRVLIRLSGEAAVGDRVHLVRPERLLPPYGRVFHSTGQGTILSILDGTATVEVDRLYGRVEVGNIAVRMPAYEAPLGESQAAGGLEGVLLDLALPQPVSGTEDLAFVDLGEASGVSLGDLFEVYIPQIVTEAGLKPEVPVGRVQVVRTTRLTSTVRIVTLEQPLLEAGLPVRLVAKLR